MLEAIIESGDRVAIEGDNQKRADFLAAALAKVDPARIHDLHMVQSVLALPDHLTVTAKIPGIDPDTFQSIASKTKAWCPVSKLINAEIGFEATLSP